MPSINEEILSDFVENQVNISRVSQHLQNKYVRDLLLVHSFVVDQINSLYPGFQETATISAQRKRLKELLDIIEQRLEETYDTIEENLQKELIELGIKQVQFTSNTLDKNVGISLGGPHVTENMVNTFAKSFMLIRGSPYADVFNGLTATDTKRIIDTVRVGFVAGTPTQDIVRLLRGDWTGRTLNINGKRVREYTGGVMTTGVRQLDTAVRTSVQTLANDTRMMELERNSDILKGVQFVATLDLRISPICISYEGYLYDFERKQLNNLDKKKRWPGPPPLHPNCRTTLSPSFKSFDEYQDEFPRLSGKLPEGTRASMDGEVPERVSYPDILNIWEDRYPGRARRVLGATRYKLWKAGELDLRDLSNEIGRPQTVAELVA